MEIKTTVTFNHSIDQEEIAKFKAKVFEYVQEEIDEECNITINDISDEIVVDFLDDALPVAIEEHFKGYADNSGVMLDDYFNSIWFDYYGETVRNWVQELGDQIVADLGEE